MRDRRFYRRISRPNNSRKASSEMIRCLSDYWTAVGGYLVNLVSHRPTCLGIRVGSFRALIQHTEVDMLVTSRRLGLQTTSSKNLLVQQYRTSTWWRNLNAFVPNRTHLPYRWNYPATMLCVAIFASIHAQKSRAPDPYHICRRYRAQRTNTSTRRDQRQRKNRTRKKWQSALLSSDYPELNFWSLKNEAF